MSAKYSAKSANRICAASNDVLYGSGKGVRLVQFATEPQLAVCPSTGTCVMQVNWFVNQRNVRNWKRNIDLIKPVCEYQAQG